ncbi:MAG: site-specific DNA-methyltransferase [Syntrophaceae bacterium]|nr:site-specific DNA-methyltransferase [Syntrophaceae bacterium]
MACSLGHDDYCQLLRKRRKQNRMTSAKEKFQVLLRDLFKFDCADLDFGIYRIMNYKRDIIQRFITQELPKKITDELDLGALADQSQATQDLAETVRQITESLGTDALDADGHLVEAYHATPLGKKYLSLKNKADGGRGSEALEVTIFNHLHTFFSRYYQDGDFISKRRYSKRQRYAIPYNGEEVHLHWANRDQYYIKTAEHFHDYTFTSGGATIHFKLKVANVEQNNVKGETRFFIPRIKEIDWEEKASLLVIPFEYRPLTDQEAITYSTKNQQDKIIAGAVGAIPRLLKTMDKALLAVAAEHHKNSDGQSVSFLEHHLRQYTRRNTSDFFIHKDLKGFLSGELDFYLKNEVLNLDEMAIAGEGRSEGWFQLMRVIKSVGSQIIDFLDQIESFQKMLWKKIKFIKETQYCITVCNIDESFYPIIAACDAQWAEWKELFHIDEEQSDLFSIGKSKKDKRIAFLKAHPTLVLDTKHFAADFVNHLISSQDDLDGSTDGLLVHSENYQALRLLVEKYRENVKCIYIDPPYNSKTTEILYKNTYKHSSWLSLMDNRLEMSRRFSTYDGSHVVAIDENEQEVLGQLLTKHFPDHKKVCVTVVHNKKGIQGDYFSYSHDFAFFCIPAALSQTNGRPVPEAEWDYDNLRKWGRESERETARNCFYPIIVQDEKIIDFGSVCDEDFHPGQANILADKQKQSIAVYPVDSQGVERKWRYARNSVEKIRHLLKVHVTTSGEVQILKAKAEKPFKTVWDDPKYIAGDYGTKWLTDLGLKIKEDLYPKSIHTVEDSIFALSDPDSFVLDYFAGSGTTGHAVIKLNRDEDCSQRRFLLVEMGEYFDTVTLPRIKKVIFSPDWKDGKPQRMVTTEETKRSPRIVKYIRLESYEDSLSNIDFDEASGQQALKFDDYLLKYMLKWETRRSETLLNVEKLAKPFNYKLTVAMGDESVEHEVDIPETFNYLLGLHVKTRKGYDDDGRRYLVYRGQIDHRQVAVIWRDTEDWQKKDLERDKNFVANQKLTEGADEVFVNGDSFIPNAKALEPVFKARMFSPVG